MTFREFAVEAMTLKACQDLQGAAVLWQKALRGPQSSVIQRRGQNLLGRFRGVSLKERTADGMEHTVQQGQVLQEEEGVKSLGERPAALLSKWERSLKKWSVAFGRLEFSALGLPSVGCFAMEALDFGSYGRAKGSGEPWCPRAAGESA